MTSVILLAIGLLPASEPTDVRVSHVEVNNVVDDAGKLTFTQHIFYAADSEGTQRIIYWKFSRTCRADGPEKASLPIAVRGGYVCWVLDGGLLLRVRAANAFESTANFDHENEARAKYSMERRRGLLGQP